MPILVPPGQQPSPVGVPARGALLEPPAPFGPGTAAGYNYFQKGNGSGGTGGTLSQPTRGGSTLIVYVVSNSATVPTITTTGQIPQVNLTCGYYSAGHNGDYTGIFYLLNTPPGITGYTTSGIYASSYREMTGIPPNPIVYWNFGGNATAGTAITVGLSGYAVSGDFSTECTAYDVSNSNVPINLTQWGDATTCSTYGETGYQTGTTAGSTTALSSMTYDWSTLSFKQANQVGTPPVNWTAVPGTFVNTLGTSGQGSFAVTPVGVGNLLVVYFKIASTTITITGVSGAGTGSPNGGASGTPWTQALPNFNDTATQVQSAWIGQVTAAGSTTLNFTFSAAIGTTSLEVCVQEFNPGTGASWTYTVDTSNTQINSSTANYHTWPAVTPSTTNGELWVGFARVPGLPGPGTLRTPSAPAVLQQDSNNNPFMYALNLVSAFNPQLWDTTSAASYCSAFLVIATPTIATTEADQAGAADQVAVSAAVPLPEAAGAVESLSVVVTLPLADVAAAADTETVAAAVPLAEVAGASESQAIALPQADVAAAADTILPAAAVPLPDVAAAAEALVAGSFQWIQSASKQSALTTSIGQAYANNVSSGTKLIALVGASTAGGATTTTSVHDSQSTPNQMVKLGAQALSNNEGEISLWAMDTPAADVGTKPTITATCSASGSGMAIMVCEVGGLAVGNTVAAMLDGAIAWVSGTALGTLASPSYTSSNPGEFLIAFYGDWGNPTTWTNPSGFQGATAGPGTSGATTGIQNSQEDSLEIAYKKSTGGAETAQYANTGTTGPWLVGMVAFLPAVSLTATTEADAAGAVDALSVHVAVPLADTGASSEASAVAVALGVVDQAAAAETAGVTATVPLAEQAGGADSAAASATVPLADQAAAVESQLIGVSSADAAGATEALAVVVTVPLAERAAAVESQVIGIAQADAAGAADSIAVSVPAPQADTAGAAEAVSVSAAVPLAEAAGAAESLSVVVSVPLSETAGAAESNAIAVTTALQDAAAAVEQQVIGITQADAAGATEALSVQVSVPLAERAAAVESQLIGVSAADVAAGSEQVTVAASVPEADVASAADTAAVTVTLSVADAAGAAESISVVVGNLVTPQDVAGATDQVAVTAGVPVSDDGGASEQVTVTATLSVAEAAGAADAISVQATVPVSQADAAGAAELLTASATVPLTDAAGAADALTGTVALSVPDAAGAVDTISVVVGNAVSVADAGAAADQLTAAATVPDADVAAGAEALSISSTVPAPETAAAAEQLAVAATTSVTEAAGAAETLSVLVVQPTTEADAAAAVDALSVVVSVPLADAAGTSEQTTASVVLALSDVSGATDRVAALPVITFLPPTEWTARPERSQWHAVPMTLQWEARPELAQWRAEIFPLQWHAEPGPTQWIAEPERPQWRVEMQDFDPVAAISTEFVNIRWTSDLDGTTIDPTTAPDTCTYAMPVSSGDVTAPAEPSQWYTGEWLIGGKGKGFVQQCTVGPSTSGPTLQAGTKYDVWGSVAGVRKFVGVLTVY